MKIAKVVSMLCLLAMTIILIFGFAVGDFLDDGAELLSHPWGIVSLVDLYVGFVLFSCWIIYREESIIMTVIWVALMMVLGFFTGALYTFLALQKSGGDWNRFWLGKHAAEDN